MKTYIKSFGLYIVLMTTCVFYAEAQTRAYFVNFNYDNTGNRTSRVIMNGDDRNNDISTYTTNENNVNLYHNPTTNSVFVSVKKTDEESTLTATLLSPSGVPLTTNEISTTPVEFDLSDMAAGIYTIEIRNGTNIKTWKIIKK